MLYANFKITHCTHNVKILLFIKSMVFHHTCLPATIIIYRPICLSAPSVFLVIRLIIRTNKPYTFSRFHFFIPFFPAEYIPEFIFLNGL